MDEVLRVGTAGWSIPRAVDDRFPDGASILARYAQALPAVEINSSFYRPHRRATYERWAATTPEAFAFAVKAPKSVTHERRLRDADALLARFLDEIGGLGAKLGAVLIQLPPSLPFDETAETFLRDWRDRHAGPTVCEPRHPSWFTPAADAALGDAWIARVAADPAVVPQAAEPGGWRGLTYLRLHGSPRMYASAYGPDALAAAARRLDQRPTGTVGWCIFDNTMLGAATENALALATCAGPPRRA